MFVSDPTLQWNSSTYLPCSVTWKGTGIEHPFANNAMAQVPVHERSDHAKDTQTMIKNLNVMLDKIDFDLTAHANVLHVSERVMVYMRVSAKSMKQYVIVSNFAPSAHHLAHTALSTAKCLFNSSDANYASREDGEEYKDSDYTLVPPHTTAVYECGDLS